MIIHEKTSISGNSIAGKMMVLEGMILFVPLIVIPFYPREAKLSVIFLIPACLSVVAGLFVCRYGKQIGNSSRLVVFSWFYGILLAAVPFAYYHEGTEKELLENEQIEEASTYAGCYVLIYILGTVLLTFFSGCTLVQGSFGFASSLGTVGLSIGVTNSKTSAICLFIEIVGMVLGRLEIFVIFKAFKK